MLLAVEGSNTIFSESEAEPNDAGDLIPLCYSLPNLYNILV